MQHFEQNAPQFLKSEQSFTCGSLQKADANFKTLLVAGTSHPEFAENLATLVGQSLFPIDVSYFPDGECRVRFHGDAVGKQAIIIQSLAKKPNEYIIETMLIADALRRAGVERIVLVCPYLAYSRQSMPEQDSAKQNSSPLSSSSLAARLFAHFLHEAGVHELVTMDLHADHIPSFYDFPVQHITAREELVTKIIEKQVVEKPLVVVGPDLGSAKLVGHYAEDLGVEFALLQKKRVNAHLVEVLSLVGDIKGKNVLLADDMCSTAGTLVSAAKVCQEKGAKQIFAVVTHGLFVGEAIEKLHKSAIKKIFVSNTIAHSEEILKSPKICVLSVVSSFAAAVKRLIRQFS